jgi:hypothetical protein
MFITFSFCGVRKDRTDVITEAPVEDGQNQAQAGIELLRPQADVQVAGAVRPDLGAEPAFGVFDIPSSTPRTDGIPRKMP